MNKKQEGKQNKRQNQILKTRSNENKTGNKTIQKSSRWFIPVTVGIMLIVASIVFAKQSIPAKDFVENTNQDSMISSQDSMMTAQESMRGDNDGSDMKDMMNGMMGNDGKKSKNNMDQGMEGNMVQNMMGENNDSKNGMGNMNKMHAQMMEKMNNPKFREEMQQMHESMHGKGSVCPMMGMMNTGGNLTKLPA